MGLDVYMYRYDNYKESRKKEKEYSDKSELIWKEGLKGRKYEELTQQEKDEIDKKTDALAKEMGLGKYGEDEEHEERIDLDSNLYPEHNFKIGYFRSSYNDGGTNSVLNRTIGKDLYYIFDTGGEDEKAEYTDWTGALERGQEVLKEFKAWVKENGKFDVMDLEAVPLFPKEMPKNKMEALKSFLEEQGRWKGDTGFDGYSNGKGSFFKKGIKCYGFIAGTQSIIGTRPTVYAIIGGNYKYYIEALEIVMETIDYVLRQDNPEQYHLHWSG